MQNPAGFTSLHNFIPYLDIQTKTFLCLWYALFHMQGKAGGPTNKRVIYGASTLNNAKQFLKQVSVIFFVAYLFLLQGMLYTCLMCWQDV
jgi:hypothetical protein